MEHWVVTVKNNNKHHSCSHLLSIYSMLWSEATSLNPHSPKRPGLQPPVCRWENCKSLVHSHPAGKWQSQESNPGCPTPKARTPAPTAGRSRCREKQGVDSGQMSVRTWWDSRADTQAQVRDGLQRGASGFGVTSWRVNIEARGVPCVERGAGGSGGDLSTPVVVGRREAPGP